MKTIKTAVIGTGVYGRHHINAYLHHPATELVAVCDLDVARCAAVAEALHLRGYSCPAALLEEEEVDVVSVATADPCHTWPALEAIRRGKHVLVEAPLATRVADCREICRAAETHDVRVGVDFHRRWDPAILRVKQALAEPLSGHILRGHLSLDDVVTVPTRRLSWAAQSSPVWFLGSHGADLVRFLSGQDVRTVYAVGQKSLLAELGTDTWDSVQSLLTLDDGSTWGLDTGWVLPAGFPQEHNGQLTLLCDNVCIRCDSRYRGPEIADPWRTCTPDSAFISYRDSVARGFGTDPIHDFIRAVIDGTPYAATVEDGLQASRICEAVHRSLESGQPENL